MIWLAVTNPAIPVSDYAQNLLFTIAAAIVVVVPYAAGITAFAIGVGMLRRWLGHRNATSLGAPEWTRGMPGGRGDRTDPDSGEYDDAKDRHAIRSQAKRRRSGR